MSSLRRPQTVNSTNRWLTSEEYWQKLSTDLLRPGKYSAAMDRMRRLDAAGRIMETVEGDEPIRPCSWCSEHKLYCKVLRNPPVQSDIRCAHCHSSGVGACDAQHAAPIESVLPSGRHRDDSSPPTSELSTGDDVIETDPTRSIGSQISEAKSEHQAQPPQIVELSLDEFLAQVRTEVKEEIRRDNAVLIPALMEQIKGELCAEMQDQFRSMIGESHNEITSRL
ncbi:uncharacterized protein K489DRAFT_381443 [Dissoconium aciculare CBS 342.82]|uniref:Uncharacterized protein n=1 Tax=Dissoconium aciculare CBS 342.82 TaxID=1314786 RepID=A0A6J3M0B0_9PEZI|nr:uncharacterized protein K489DRAFT_381443 [Dissoconium aciculare CBS 342.82]KAF1821451.1 hypothetical protein K489DRAFT_381443 [Dissoconium aciculare CBS 342.82]